MGRHGDPLRRARAGGRPRRSAGAIPAGAAALVLVATATVALVGPILASLLRSRPVRATAVLVGISTSALVLLASVPIPVPGVVLALAVSRSPLDRVTVARSARRVAYRLRLAVGGLAPAPPGPCGPGRAAAARWRAVHS